MVIGFRYWLKEQDHGCKWLKWSSSVGRLGVLLGIGWLYSKLLTWEELGVTFISDASWLPPWVGVLGMSHRNEAMRKTQDMLEELHLSAGTSGSYQKSWIRLHLFILLHLLCLINQTRRCTPKIAGLLLFLNVDLYSRGKVSMFSRFLQLTDCVWCYSQWACSGGEVISAHLLSHLPSSRGGASSLASGFLPDSCHWLFMILLLRLIVHMCLHLIGSCSISIIYVLCSDYYCFVAVICICDIYCTSAVMEKIISPLWFSLRFLLFPIMDFFFSYPVWGTNGKACFICTECKPPLLVNALLGHWPWLLEPAHTKWIQCIVKVYSLSTMTCSDQLTSGKKLWRRSYLQTLQRKKAYYSLC